MLINDNPVYSESQFLVFTCGMWGKAGNLAFHLIVHWAIYNSFLHKHGNIVKLILDTLC